MQPCFKFNLKGIKRKNLIVAGIIFLSAAIISGVSAYYYISKRPVSAQTLHGTAPVQHNTAQVQSAPPAPEQKQTVSDNEKVQITDKNPFKAEFLSRYEKKVRAKTEGNLESLPKINVVTREPVILPAVHPATPDPGVSGENVKKEPSVTVKGVYKIKNTPVAITDRGEIRIGQKIDSYLVRDITMEGKITWEATNDK